jgi:hypothetical protein
MPSRPPGAASAIPGITRCSNRLLKLGNHTWIASVSSAAPEVLLPLSVPWNLAALAEAQKLPPKTLASLRGEDKVRLNADIPRALYKKVKRRAVGADTTITGSILKLLAEYLSD